MTTTKMYKMWANDYVGDLLLLDAVFLDLQNHLKGSLER